MTGMIRKGYPDEPLPVFSELSVVFAFEPAILHQFHFPGTQSTQDSKDFAESAGCIGRKFQIRSIRGQAGLHPPQVELRWM